MAKRARAAFSRLTIAFGSSALLATGLIFGTALQSAAAGSAVKAGAVMTRCTVNLSFTIPSTQKAIGDLTVDYRIPDGTYEAWGGRVVPTGKSCNQALPAGVYSYVGTTELTIKRAPRPNTDAEGDYYDEGHWRSEIRAGWNQSNSGEGWRIGPTGQFYGRPYFFASELGRAFLDRANNQVGATDFEVWGLGRQAETPEDFEASYCFSYTTAVCKILPRKQIGILVITAPIFVQGWLQFDICQNQIPGPGLLSIPCFDTQGDSDTADKYMDPRWLGAKITLKMTLDVKSLNP